MMILGRSGWILGGFGWILTDDLPRWPWQQPKAWWAFHFDFRMSASNQLRDLFTNAGRRSDTEISHFYLALSPYFIFMKCEMLYLVYGLLYGGEETRQATRTCHIFLWGHQSLPASHRPALRTAVGSQETRCLTDGNGTPGTPELHLAISSFLDGTLQIS